MEKSPPISETAVIQERKIGEYGVSGGGGGGAVSRDSCGNLRWAGG